MIWPCVLEKSFVWKEWFKKAASIRKISLESVIRVWSVWSDSSFIRESLFAARTKKSAFGILPERRKKEQQERIRLVNGSGRVRKYDDD